MRLLILGANSDIAYAVAQQFAKSEKAALDLASRDVALLDKKVTDLNIRYQVTARAMAFDATDPAGHAGFYQALDPKPDGVLVAFGHLGDQQKAQHSFDEARRIIETNFCGAVSILEIIAADFEQRGHGFIIAISSVAGERGRQSNYIYGAAKGALSIYLSGLRNRLSPHQVHVLTVLPGFVRTKMTRDLDLPAALTATPEQVANDIYKAFKAKKSCIYTLWLWRWVMAIIKAIPEPLFKRLKL
jgi:decaprenylphospho-beta-D-erythro-pentofuranosid-2-ulose 2-reductase